MTMPTLGRPVGFVGLGRMGASMVRNAVARGLHAVVFDIDPAAVAELTMANVEGAESLADLVDRLPAPRVVWVMVPAGKAVENVIFGEGGLAHHMAAGDVLIDGGNSYFRDSVQLGQRLAERGIHFLDSGTSGGLEGALHGLCMMIGGTPEAFAVAEPLFSILAGEKGGYRHVGPVGAGHYVKMVHNGIEYGMLEAIGEGFELLADGPYPGLDLAEIAELWQEGSVVRSWLMELAERAFRANPQLEGIADDIGGGSTGRWAIDTAWNAGVPMPAIALAYMMRLRSRQNETFAGKTIAALRYQFGGHAVSQTKP